MKKIATIFLSLLLWGVVVQPTLAVESSPGPRGPKVGTVKEKIQKFLGRHAKIVDGELKSISGQTLVVSRDGTDYTVNVTDNTKLRRRFWGKSELSEFSVGDKVSVYGKWANEEKTAIDAQLIRNLSIQKRRGTFFGTVLSIEGQTLVVKTAKRGDQTVTIGDTTKIVNRKMEAMTVSDLKVDDKVRVKGLWDRANNTITEVTQVKDFSQPTRPTASPEAAE